VRAGDLTSAASRYWNIGPQLAVPLFSGGRLRSGVRAAQAELDAALADYQGTVLRALSDAESGIVRYGAASTRFEAIASIADARDSGVAVMRRRHLAGDISTLELLSVERLAQDAGDQKAAAAVELAVSYVALNKALGGGWQRP
jgi:outer membrane protein TolC